MGRAELAQAAVDVVAAACSATERRRTSLHTLLAMVYVHRPELRKAGGGFQEVMLRRVVALLLGRQDAPLNEVRLLQLAWLGWHLCTRARRREARLADCRMAACKAQCLLDGFRAWSQASKRLRERLKASNVVLQLVGQTDWGQVQLCFRNWHQEQLRLRNNRDLVLKSLTVFGDHGQALSAAVFSAWQRERQGRRDEVQLLERLRLNDAHEKVLGKALGLLFHQSDDQLKESVLKAWQRLLRRSQQRVREAQQAYEERNARARGQAFAAWQEQVQLRKRVERRCRELAAMWLSSLEHMVESIFQAWSRPVLQQLQHVKLSRHFLAILRSSASRTLINLAFNAWLTWLEHSRHEDHKTKSHCAMLWVLSASEDGVSLSMAMRAWSLFISHIHERRARQIQHEKAMNGALTALANGIDSALVSSAFHEWKLARVRWARFEQRGSRREQLMLACLQGLASTDSMMGQTILHAWSKFSSREKYVQKAESSMRRMAVWLSNSDSAITRAAVWSQWKKWAQHSRHWRDEQRHALVAQKFAVLMGDANEEINLRVHFNSWRNGLERKLQQALKEMRSRGVNIASHMFRQVPMAVLAGTFRHWSKSIWDLKRGRQLQEWCATNLGMEAGSKLLVSVFKAWHRTVEARKHEEHVKSLAETHRSRSRALKDSALRFLGAHEATLLRSAFLDFAYSANCEKRDRLSLQLQHKAAARVCLCAGFDKQLGKQGRRFEALLAIQAWRRVSRRPRAPEVVRKPLERCLLRLCLLAWGVVLLARERQAMKRRCGHAAREALARWMAADAVLSVYRLFQLWSSKIQRPTAQKLADAKPDAALRAEARAAKALAALERTRLAACDALGQSRDRRLRASALCAWRSLRPRGLYVFGGFADTAKMAELLDNSGTWVPLPQMPQPRCAAAAAWLDGCVHVVGGFHGPMYLTAVDRLCTTERKWLEPTHLKESRGYACVAASSQLYTIGGFNGVEHLASVERFNPNALSWDGLPQMSRRRQCAAASVIGEHIYVVGGDDGSGPLCHAERLTPSGWEQLPPMAVHRSGCAAVAMCGRLFVLGGHDAEPLSSMEVFDLQAWSWTQLPPMSVPRDALGAASIGSSIVVFGGHSEDGELKSMERFHVHTRKWLTMPDAHTARNFAAVSAGPY